MLWYCRILAQSKCLAYTLGMGMQLVAIYASCYVKLNICISGLRKACHIMLGFVIIIILEYDAYVVTLIKHEYRSRLRPRKLGSLASIYDVREV